MPKASNMHEQYSKPVGGPVSGQNFSNFGKVNLPQHQVQNFIPPSPVNNFQVQQHEQVKEYNKISTVNQFEGTYQIQ